MPTHCMYIVYTTKPIPCYDIVYMYHIFFLHLCGDGHVGWFKSLAAVDSTSINMVQVSLIHKVSSILGVYSIAGLLDHVASLFLAVKEVSTLFSIVVP